MNIRHFSTYVEPNGVNQMGSDSIINCEWSLRPRRTQLRFGESGTCACRLSGTVDRFAVRAESRRWATVQNVWPHMAHAMSPFLQKRKNAETQKHSGTAVALVNVNSL